MKTSNILAWAIGALPAGLLGCQSARPGAVINTRPAAATDIEPVAAPDPELAGEALVDRLKQLQEEMEDEGRWSVYFDDLVYYSPFKEMDWEPAWRQLAHFSLFGLFAKDLAAALAPDISDQARRKVLELVMTGSYPGSPDRLPKIKQVRREVSRTILEKVYKVGDASRWDLLAPKDGFPTPAPSAPAAGNLELRQLARLLEDAQDELRWWVYLDTPRADKRFKDMPWDLVERHLARMGVDARKIESSLREALAKATPPQRRAEALRQAQADLPALKALRRRVALAIVEEVYQIDLDRFRSELAPKETP